MTNDHDLARHHGLEGDVLVTSLHREFGDRLALVSSFGADSVVLLHMVACVDQAIPVIFLDTGKHFWQTGYYRSKIIDLLGLKDVRIIRPHTGDVALLDPHGTLSGTDPDACCDIRKVRPLEHALEGFDAVLSGRKRYHGEGRDSLVSVSRDGRGRVKGEPLAGYDAQAIAGYLKQHDLPTHPLVEQGYFSIGCADCTKAGGSADDPRAGRWAGRDKTECGIHLGADGQLVRTQQNGV
ncbi:phosphoadenylyl-sulfate reductase [Anderseniella sp. Alg231-50]|uniref:phosphoadenylyl-sulfate reductase n=1 Tax=Anderseniella sp. Alg231-50 TaxID=1922226 RepID=UPI00307BE343